MKIQVARNLALFFGLVHLSVTAAGAQSWEEQQVRNRERQRQALEQQARQGPSPQVLQAQRWEAEWRQQHPGQPVPNLGVLEKMHQGEIIQNMNNGFERMRQNRQRELQRNYQWARQAQQAKLAAQHISWSPQQWQNWDRAYNAEQMQRAKEYLDAVHETGQIQEAERQRRIQNGESPW